MDRAFRRNLDDRTDLLYTDTDSAILRQEKNKNLDFEFGNGYRQWKSENPDQAELKTYCALGPKSYSYSYNLNGCDYSSIKCKGFSLKNNSGISHEEMMNMVTERKTGQITSKTLPQFVIRIEKKSRKLYNSYFFKTLSSDILKKRVLVSNEPYTMPYGYTSRMLQENVLT